MKSQIVTSNRSGPRRALPSAFTGQCVATSRCAGWSSDAPSVLYAMLTGQLPWPALFSPVSLLNNAHSQDKMGSQGAGLLLLHDTCFMGNAMSKYGAG